MLNMLKYNILNIFAYKVIFFRIHLFEMETFCNIINVFTVTFDQFNASLLNKNINLFKKRTF